MEPAPLPVNGFAPGAGGHEPLEEDAGPEIYSYPKLLTRLCAGTITRSEEHTSELQSLPEKSCERLEELAVGDDRIEQA